MKTPLVLIVAYPSPLRDGLRILLQTLTSIGAIQLAEKEDLLSNTMLVLTPQLIVWDWAYPLERVRSLHCKVRARWPSVRLLALVEDDTQGELALTAGADAILTKGTPAAKLLSTVSDLLKP